MTTTPAAAEFRRTALPHAGAVQFLGLSGWRIPAHFGDPEAEYRAASEGVALFDAGFLTFVSATGKDQIDYLNRRLSQRILDLEAGTVLRANQLGGDGRMLADLEVLRPNPEGEGLLLIGPPATSGEGLAALCERYVFSEDCQFADAGGLWSALALLGPKADGALRALGGPVPAPGEVLAWPAEDGGARFVLRSTFLPQGVLVVGSPGSVASLYAAFGVSIPSLGWLAFDTVRIEQGIAWWGIDLTVKSIPLEADLNIAVHPNKGCYPGQETIAKIVNLGHPARKLVGVIWDTEDPPAPGVEITSGGVAAGVLTSSTWSPRQSKAIGLAMVRWNYRAVGTGLEIGLIRGKVATLPFSV